jgi:hypothetical protein
MATAEDRQHAQHLLYEYRRRLRGLELRTARQGMILTDPSVELEIEELRLNIATLEALTEPEPTLEVQEVVRAHVEMDYMFLFTQFVKFGSRLTGVEQRVENVVQHQSRADVWRLGATEDMQGLKAAQSRNDAARQRGQRRYLVLFIVIVILVVLGLIARTLYS